MKREVLGTFRRYEILSGFDSEALKRADAEQMQIAVVRGVLPVEFRSHFDLRHSRPLLPSIETRHISHARRLTRTWQTSRVIWLLSEYYHILRYPPHGEIGSTDNEIHEQPVVEPVPDSETINLLGLDLGIVCYRFNRMNMRDLHFNFSVTRKHFRAFVT